MRILRCSSLFVGALVLSGCGNPRPVALDAPTYDPKVITQAAMQALDKNGNGDLDAAELATSPGLKAALALIDKNKDGKISAEELEKRVEEYKAYGNNPIYLTCNVTFNEVGVPGAKVTFTPEPFFGSNLAVATGTTDANGVCAEFDIGGKKFPGLMAGVYKVSVTKDGEPAIPEKYNTKTTLGREVFGVSGRGGDPTIELRLKGN
jgi:hypothetical protein